MPAVTDRTQDGAVVVEFALVFVLFAMLVSGIVSFGAAFAAQQSLTHAAAEGARTLVGLDPAAMEAQAEAVALDQVDWLEDTDMTLAGPESCGAATCYTVTVTGSSPVPEILPVFSGDDLSASATVQVD